MSKKKNFFLGLAVWWVFTAIISILEKQLPYAGLCLVLAGFSWATSITLGEKEEHLEKIKALQEELSATKRAGSDLYWARSISRPEYQDRAIKNWVAIMLGDWKSVE